MRARALAPRRPDPHAELGVLAQSSCDFDVSIEHLSVAIKLAPRHAGHYKERGCSQFYRGNFAAAETDLRYSINLADDPYALLFWYLSCRKIGQIAGVEFVSRAARLRRRQWPFPIIELYLGKSGVEAVRTAASNPDERAEAEFYIGEWYLLRGNRAQAVAAFQVAVRSCPTWLTEYPGALTELKQLE